MHNAEMHNAAMNSVETNAAMDVPAELKGLRLHGMAGAWADLAEQGGSAGLDTSRWLLEHLLHAETTDRLIRSVNHQMCAANFPAHRDMAGFDFESSRVDRGLVDKLGAMAVEERIICKFGRLIGERVFRHPIKPDAAFRSV